MAYTAKLTPGGLYEVFKDGQRVSTGTAGSLSMYGLSPTKLSTQPTTVVETPSTQTSYVPPPTFAPPPVSEAQYQSIRQMVSGGQLTPQGAVDELNKQIKSGQYSGSVDTSRLFPSDFSYAGADKATYKVGSNLQPIRTSAAFSQTNITPQSIATSLEELKKRIATEGITDASGKVLLAPQSIGSVVPPPTTAGATPPTLPTPQAGGTNDAFMTSMLAGLETKRKAVEDAYAKEIADLKIQSEASQKKIDDLTTLQQEGVIAKAQELSQPFRQSLEEAKSKELYITQNFEENQKLTNELSTLLTEGNDLIRQQKGITGLEAIRNPRINQTISDVNARAGVIQAVMSARSGQIAEAQRMIDRTVSAITADKTDQLNYYSTLYNFYQDKKNEEGKKLAILSADKKKFLELQIDLLENDLKTVENNAQKMKEMFIDPDKALKFAKAGISLNTPQSEWGQKLADQAYAEELAKVSNERANDGYSTTPISGVVPVQTIDSRGVVKNWYKAGAKKEDVFTGFSGDELIKVKADIKEYGLDKVLAGITDPKQVAEIKKISGEVEKEEVDTKQFLTKDYLKNLFTEDQLKNDAEEAGFRGFWSSWKTEKEKYLNYLEDTVKSYREAGYTDKEILKLMK